MGRQRLPRCRGRWEGGPKGVGQEGVIWGTLTFALVGSIPTAAQRKDHMFASAPALPCSSCRTTEASKCWETGRQGAESYRGGGTGSSSISIPNPVFPTHVNGEKNPSSLNSVNMVFVSVCVL